ncbi:hypothetical protein DPMN_101741 [Dreissena polymorpha]|uniref:Uncharacterized protein n=1 Tax=Dreissena polymorpha TaxID=45954 RepID=A0A9D4R8K7_DREPO|nr:hypothetical protein DPMN_101741 [Dreissena polymorpha]
MAMTHDILRDTRSDARECSTKYRPCAGTVITTKCVITQKNGTKLNTTRVGLLSILVIRNRSSTLLLSGVLTLSVRSHVFLTSPIMEHLSANDREAAFSMIVA